MKELEREIERAKEELRKENEEYQQETMKYGLHSNGAKEIHNRRCLTLEKYIEGLEKAKELIEGK
jgi:hypothetical protein